MGIMPSKDILQDIEDAEFADAEQQLRLYGLGHIERKGEAWWFEAGMGSAPVL
jgi:hypothetical protein